jgi:transposase InsO family protein/transposase-like protein
MEEQSAQKKQSNKARRRRSQRGGPYPFEFRLEAVKKYVEEGYPASLITDEMAISGETLHTWTKRYRQYGEAGLRDLRNPPKRSLLSQRVKEKIVELKKSNPGFGSRRISDVLKRFFLMPASSATVHTTLSKAHLTNPQKKKAKRNPGKPRFFERSTPNQLWQSDICPFRLGGQNAYLIGFIDDYSRYITGIGLYRSQTAENVLEVYRSAIGEYGVPKEMLTDNGRQYTNWRGTTRFEQELKKERVRHIRSRPHHPMTLGKIERFWKTILDEFLFRAQFSSFEEARERIRLWVTYYNHKRPHQGIKGLCPADRFFEIAHELKKTLEQGMEENVLEMALRGKPRDPFYMVGRMGDQSVVIRAEKGKVKMLLDGEEPGQAKELVYDVRKDDSSPEQQGNNQQQVSAPAGHEQEESAPGCDAAELIYGCMPQDAVQSGPRGVFTGPGDKEQAESNGGYLLVEKDWDGEEYGDEDEQERYPEEPDLAPGGDNYEGAVWTDEGD